MGTPSRRDIALANKEAHACIDDFKVVWDKAYCTHARLRITFSNNRRIEKPYQVSKASSYKHMLDEKVEEIVTTQLKENNEKERDERPNEESEERQRNKARPSIKDKCLQSLHAVMEYEIAKVESTFNAFLEAGNSNRAWNSWNQGINNAFVKYFELNGFQSRIARIHGNCNMFKQTESDIIWDMGTKGHIYRNQLPL